MNTEWNEIFKKLLKSVFLNYKILLVLLYASVKKVGRLKKNQFKGGPTNTTYYKYNLFIPIQMMRLVLKSGK